MNKYRAKHIKSGLVLECVRYTGNNIGEILQWSNSQIVKEKHDSADVLFQPHSIKNVPVGSWIIKDFDDYIIVPNIIFESIYVESKNHPDNEIVLIFLNKYKDFLIDEINLDTSVLLKKFLKQTEIQNCNQT